MIEWKGGECPVGKDVMVRAKLRGYRFNPGDVRPASDWDWSVVPGGSLWADIVAYEVVEPSFPPEAVAAQRIAQQIGEDLKATFHPLPTGAKARKAIPIYSGFVKYFPDAIVAVAELSRKGNDQHNPGKPLFWDRSKSGDELDALMRHLVDAGTYDTDGVRHSTKVAWRALANLQKEIEEGRE